MGYDRLPPRIPARISEANQYPQQAGSGMGDGELILAGGVGYNTFSSCTCESSQSCGISPSRPGRMVTPAHARGVF